ncbi:hypothetical protein [Glycomyces buryatensis]|uniref:DUF3303 domain-containing protein n=1 Tax=Glycomyces buryatensis TaxID=2570927 RepID=A0A4S8Q7V7_9ACTN|nr:hypothetical protein [Glycomyces buryatensis]THV40230.1 hypothetical protein FAB82_16185 [Glycomyces buryatensis]
MRVCLKVQIPVEAGNKAIMEGGMPKQLKSAMDELKPEAVYFFPQDGMRSMMFFFDLKNTASIPTLVEPLFEGLNAKVDITPAMNFDDLMSGMKTLQNHR